MISPDRSLWFRRLAALVAAVALALPAPRVPGGPGPPGTGLRVAPADHLRAGPARRTAIGLEELPRALDRTPDTVPAGGLEEPYQGSLAELPLEEKHGQPVYRLPKGMQVPIPLRALASLPGGGLVLLLAEDDYLLVWGEMLDDLFVVRAKQAMRLADTLPVTVCKVPFAVASDSIRTSPLVVGRAEAMPVGYPSLTLREAQHSTSGLQALFWWTDRGPDGSPTLWLQDRSTYGTYLFEKQVALLTGKESAPRVESDQLWSLGFALDRIGQLRPESRLFLRSGGR